MRDEFGDGLRKRLRYFIRRIAIERHTQVQSFRAGDLRERFETPGREKFSQMQRDLRAIENARRLAGVEIENN